MATNHCCGIPRLFSSVFDYEATDDGSKLRCSFKYCTCNAKWMTNVPKFTDKLSRHVGDSVDRFVTRTYGKRHLYKSGKFPIQPSLSFASGRHHVSQSKQQQQHHHQNSQSHSRYHHHHSSTADDDDDYNGDNDDAGHAHRDGGSEDASHGSTNTDANAENNNDNADGGNANDDDDGPSFYDDDDSEDYDDGSNASGDKGSGHGQDDGGSSSHNPKSGTVEDKFSSIIVVVLELDDDDDDDGNNGNGWKCGAGSPGVHDTIARWLPDVADTFYNANTRTKPHPSVIVRRFRSRKQLLDKIILEELHSALSYEHATRYYNVHLNLGGGSSGSLSSSSSSNNSSNNNLGSSNTSSGSIDGSSESTLGSSNGNGSAGNDGGSGSGSHIGGGNDSSALCMSVYSLPVFVILNVPPILPPPPQTSTGAGAGQVFCCTPSYIRREYGIREYCTVRDFVVTCQMAIGPRLCGFYIASNGALALGGVPRPIGAGEAGKEGGATKKENHRAPWPVDPAWITDGSLCTDVVGFAGLAAPAEKKACDVYVILSVMEYAIAKMRNTFEYAGTSFSTVCRVLRSMGRPLLNSVLLAQERLFPRAAASGHLALLNTLVGEDGNRKPEGKEEEEVAAAVEKRAATPAKRSKFTVGFVHTSQAGKRAAECLAMLLRDTVDTACLSADNVVSVINSGPAVEDGGAFLLVVLNYGGSDSSAAATGAKLEAILGALLLSGLGKKLCGVLNVCDAEHPALPPQYAAAFEVASMLTAGVPMSVWWALAAYTAITAAALHTPGFSGVVSQCRAECSGLAAAAGLVVLGRKEGDELAVPVVAGRDVPESEIARKAGEYYALSMRNRVPPEAADDDDDDDDDDGSSGDADERNESGSNSGGGDSAEYVYVYDNDDNDEDEYDDSDDEEYVDDYKFSEKRSSRGEGAGDSRVADPSSTSSRRHHHRHHRRHSSGSRESKERGEASAAAAPANNAEESYDEAGEGEEDDVDIYSSSSDESSNEANNNKDNENNNGNTNENNENKENEQNSTTTTATQNTSTVPVVTTTTTTIQDNTTQPSTTTTTIAPSITVSVPAPSTINTVTPTIPIAIITGNTNIINQQNPAGGSNTQPMKTTILDCTQPERELGPFPAKRVKIDPNVLSCPITAGVLFKQQQQQQNMQTVVNPPTIITPGGLPIVGATIGTKMFSTSSSESPYKSGSNGSNEPPAQDTNAIIHINNLDLGNPENQVIFTSAVAPVAPPKVLERVIHIGESAYIRAISVKLDVHISEDGAPEQNWIKGIAEYSVQEDGVHAGGAPLPFTLCHEGVAVEAVVLVTGAQSTRLDAQVTRSTTTVVIPPRPGAGLYMIVVGFHVERNNPHIVWARDADSHYAVYSLFTRPACARSLFPYPRSAMSAAIPYAVTVVTPAAYTALVPTAAPWRVKALRDGARRCSEFHVATPASLAMVALAVGRFAMRQVPDAPVPLTFWGPESLVQRAAAGLGTPLKECFRIMCEMLGFNPYPAVNVVVMPPNYPYPANQSLGTVYASMSLFDVGKPLVEYVVLELVQGYFNPLFTENVTCTRYLAKGISRYIEERIMFAQNKLKVSSEEDTLNVASLLLYRTLLAKLPSNSTQKPRSIAGTGSTGGGAGGGGGGGGSITPAASTAAAVAAAAERRSGGGAVEIPESKDDNSEVEYNDEIGYFLMRFLSQRVEAGSLCKFVGQFVTSYAGNVFTPELFVTAFFDAYRSLVSAEFNSAAILTEWFHSTSSKSIDVALDNTIRSICLSKSPNNPVLDSVDEVLVLTYKFETEIIKTDAAAKKEAIDKLETAKMSVSVWTNDQICIFLKRLCEGTLLHPETIELLDAIFLFKDMNARVRRGWCDVVHKGDYKKWISYVNNFIMNDKPFSYGVTENSHSQIPPF